MCDELVRVQCHGSIVSSQPSCEQRREHWATTGLQSVVVLCRHGCLFGEVIDFVKAWRGHRCAEKFNHIYVRER